MPEPPKPAPKTEVKLDAKPEYLIGGAILKFTEDPQALWEDFKAKLRGGVQLGQAFIVAWQRNALHFSYHAKQIHDLEEAVKKLSDRVAAIEKGRPKR